MSHPPPQPKPQPAPPVPPKPKPGPPRALGTPEEVAEYLGVPVNTLYQWRAKRIGPRASRVGKHLRYRWTDVEQWLDQQARTAA